MSDAATGGSITPFVKILLDTNVISETRRKAPHAQVQRWFEQQRSSSLYLSTFTIGEIIFGAESHQQAHVRQDIADWLSGTILPSFSGRIVGFDLEAALIYGRWAGRASMQGTTLSRTDAQIAAVAFVHGMVIATRNAKDFKRLPVRLVNPWERA
jgi:toxin FitB